MRRLAIFLAALLLPAASARAGQRRTRRITAPGEGVVRVSAEQLAAWGLGRGKLYVYSGGRGLDYVRASGSSGLKFYSAPYDSLYAAERAFLISNRRLPYKGGSQRLTASKRGGSLGRLSRFLRGRRGRKITDGPTGYLHTVHVEEDQFYLSGMTGAKAGEEHWYYSTFLMPGRSLSLTAELPGPLAAGPVSLKVALRGGTNVAGVAPDHRVIVRLNGQKVGEAVWNGYNREEAVFEIPAGLAVEGENTVELAGGALEGVPFDFVLVDWVEVSYPRPLTAIGDRLSVTLDHGYRQRLRAGGFSGRKVIGFDVTDPARPRLLVLKMKKRGGAWRAEWVTERAGRRSYVLAGPAGRLATSSDRAADPRDARLVGGHRYLVVSHADYMAAARRLAGLHGGRRGRVRVYDVEDVYDAFGCGQEIPHAIKALAKWHGPRYLCLLGDATGDMRSLLGPPGAGVIPSFLTQGSHFEEPSDNRFGCIRGGDEYPEVAVGRLPARSAAEADLLVGKIEARLAALREEEGEGYGGVRAALVVGDDDMDIFEEGAQEMAGLFNWGAVEKVMFADYGAGAEIRSAIVNGWARKPNYFVYLGHSMSTYLGRSRVLKNGHVPQLAAEKLPAGVLLGCLAGYFNFTSGADSLAERMLKEPGKGVCAVVAPAGMSAPKGQRTLGREIARALRDRDLSLGEALMRAKRQMPACHKKVLRSFNLLGDPALR